MHKYNVPVTIVAKDQQDLMMVVSAVQDLILRVGNDNLVRLAKKVKDNPAIVKTALKYI